MPRTVKVTLAGREYTIEELRSRANGEWRTKLQEPFGQLVDKLQSAGDTELSRPGDIANLVRSVAGTLVQSPDTLKGLLFDYSPTLAKDRERIEAEAYDSEILDAFTEILKLAYPFGGWVTKLASLAALGQKRPAT